MGQYVKKALVLGAGGFIGSHMVKRLKSEGYWVRGVDLKRPEFSPTEADEFVLGDLRDVNFVRRVLEYKGDRGNFYHSVPYRYIHAFDEIYQFAADMGGAGFVFTGENDADIMHNSVSINLNVLECQRKMNEEKGRNYTKIFFLDLLACIQNIINLILIILIAVKNQHTPLTQTPNTDGKNSLVRDYILPTIATTIFLYVLLVIIISSVLKEPGTVEERKRQLQSAARSLSSQSKVDLSRCGEMAYRLVPSCSLMNASKRLDD